MLDRSLLRLRMDENCIFACICAHLAKRLSVKDGEILHDGREAEVQESGEKGVC